RPVSHRASRPSSVAVSGRRRARRRRGGAPPPPPRRPSAARARRRSARGREPARRCRRSTPRRGASRRPRGSSLGRPSPCSPSLFPRTRQRASRPKVCDTRQRRCASSQVRRIAGGEPHRLRAMIDFELTDEQRLIRDTAREFTDAEIIPVARENDRAERFDTDLVKKIADMGYLGAIVSEEYGGRGLDYRTYGLIVEEIGRGDSSARTVVSVQTSLVCSSIERWGPEEQKREWLPRLCSGEALGCFGLTEPNTGSDAANLATRADKIDGGWRITGGKQWISLGNYAKVALIFAQTDPERRHR